MLMKYGTDRADEAGVEAYLEASPEGVKLYEKFGFVEKKCVEIVTDDHGPYTNLCMIRPAKEQ
jgi:hypothetical protein